MPRPTKMEERIAAVKREIESKGEDAPMHAWDVERPLRTDRSEFGSWLRTQVVRKDRIGGLARVAVEDPFWPCTDDRRVLREHFKSLSTRAFVIESLEIAFRAFDKDVGRAKRRAKNKAARQARRKNRS